MMEKYQRTQPEKAPISTGDLSAIARPDDQLQDADFVEVSHVRIRKTSPFPANNRLMDRLIADRVGSFRFPSN